MNEAFYLTEILEQAFCIVGVYTVMGYFTKQEVLEKSFK